METLTDEQLVLKIQAGDRAAFEQLYWRYKDRVISVVYGIVHNRQDAVEISQEVFVRIYKNIDKYQPGTRFFTWLYRITYNLAVDKYRRKKTAREVEFDNDYQKNFSSPEDVLPPSLGINPERACERAELRQQLTQAMDELPEKQRTIITLREVEGLSYEEIASVLDIQIGTVMSRLHYARQRLQNNLRKYLECQDIPKKD
ncbi:MAG: sigma-70 family RNA polymerase sigma factor [Proteobacteria bacterium]|nr:sigma-70 family RNA polymerase sigma factor [Pseudomonadota bacterium]MBQ9241630.1 sigma-70 family RNA polymerase sigma factor [Pseudomonadota bacterium]